MIQLTKGKKMSDAQIISAMTGQKAEDIEKNFEKSNAMAKSFFTFMKELDKCSGSNEELVKNITTNVTLMLYSLPKKERLLALMLINFTEMDGSCERFLKLSEKFRGANK